MPPIMNLYHTKQLRTPNNNRRKKEVMSHEEEESQEPGKKPYKLQVGFRGRKVHLKTLRKSLLPANNIPTACSLVLQILH
jgi:hypothetical protein